MKIFIDPGHGGDNPGAIAASGLEEATVKIGRASCRERVSVPV